MDRFKKVLPEVLFFVTILLLILLISSNLTGMVNPSFWWPVSITGLFFPILFILAFSAGIFWLFVKPKYSLHCMVAILLCIPNILVYIPFNLSADFNESKKSTELRVVTWNVNLMNYSAKNDETAIKENEKIFTILHDLNADVICLQDFFTAVIPDKRYNFIDSFRNYMGYNYSYFSRDYPKFEGNFYSGTIIFSKYKIVDSIKIKFPKPISGSIIKIGLLYQDDTIDVVSTHLQNINFGRDEDMALKDSSHDINKSPGFLKKLIYGYEDQMKQVSSVQKVLDKSNRPIIFAGDLNDVPTSYTYSNIKREMKDVWLQKGTGLGITFNFNKYPLRIDYIFYSDKFTCKQTKKIQSTASDHYGIITDLKKGMQ